MRKKRVLVTSVVIAGISLILLNFVPANSAKPIQAKVTKVQNGTISSSISAVGLTKSINEAKVYFDTPLRIQRVLVVCNQKVSKGQKLVELDMNSLESELQQLEIDKNVSELSIQKIKNSNSSNDTTYLQAIVDNAKKSIAAAEENYKKAIEEYNTKENLYNLGSIPKSELDSYIKIVQDSSNVVDEAKLSYQKAVDDLKKQNESFSQSQSNNNIELKIQEQNLQATNLKISGLERQITNINTAATAPIDGTVTEINQYEGSITNASTPIFTIIDDSKLQVIAQIKQENINSVNVGQSVSISFDSTDSSTKYTGKIQEVGAEVKEQMYSGVLEDFIEAKILFDNSTSSLKSGMKVNCEVETKVENNTLIIPFQALKEDKDNNDYVFIVDKSTSKVHTRPVKLGITSDFNVEITGGLAEGDYVVLDPSPTLYDNSVITADFSK